MQIRTALLTLLTCGFLMATAGIGKTMTESEFVEIFVDTPLAECERRDPKGLYRRARDGKLANFTGIDSPYETPETPDIHLNTTEMSLEQEIETVMKALRNRGVID